MYCWEIGSKSNSDGPIRGIYDVDAYLTARSIYTDCSYSTPEDEQVYPGSTRLNSL